MGGATKERRPALIKENNRKPFCYTKRLGRNRIRTKHNIRTMKQLEEAEKHLRKAKDYCKEILKDLNEEADK